MTVICLGITPTICEAGYEKGFMALPSGKLASPCGSEYLIAGKDPSMRFTLTNAHIGHGPLRSYWNYCRTIVAGVDSLLLPIPTQGFKGSQCPYAGGS